MSVLPTCHKRIYLFGAFLIVTGIKLYLQRGKSENPEEGWGMRFGRRVIPSTSRLDGNHFITTEDGR